MRVLELWRYPVKSLLGVLRTVHREHDHTLAVGARITRPGRIAVGDEVRTRD